MNEFEREYELLSELLLNEQVKDRVNTVLDKIKEKIEQVEINGYIRDVECFRAGINVALNVIDKYKT